MYVYIYIHIYCMDICIRILLNVTKRSDEVRQVYALGSIGILKMIYDTYVHNCTYIHIYYPNNIRYYDSLTKHVLYIIIYIYIQYVYSYLLKTTIAEVILKHIAYIQPRMALHWTPRYDNWAVAQKPANGRPSADPSFDGWEMLNTFWLVVDWPNPPEKYEFVS